MTEAQQAIADYRAAIQKLASDFSALHDAMMTARNQCERWREGAPNPNWSYWDGRAESYNDVAIRIEAELRAMTARLHGGSDAIHS